MRPNCPAKSISQRTVSCKTHLNTTKLETQTAKSLSTRTCTLCLRYYIYHNLTPIIYLSHRRLLSIPLYYSLSFSVLILHYCRLMILNSQSLVNCPDSVVSKPHCDSHHTNIQSAIKLYLDTITDWELAKLAKIGNHHWHTLLTRTCILSLCYIHNDYNTNYTFLTIIINYSFYCIIVYCS